MKIYQSNELQNSAKNFVKMIHPTLIAKHIERLRTGAYELEGDT